MNKFLSAIFVFSLIGVGISFYLYLLHIDATASSVCQINATFDCKTVDSSPYAMTFGIPNSILGMLGYGFMALGALMKLLQKKRDQILNLYLLLAATGGLGFSLYLTGVEAFILHAWCIFCIASQVVMMIVFGLALTVFLKDRKPEIKQPEENSSQE